MRGKRTVVSLLAVLLVGLLAFALALPGAAPTTGAGGGTGPEADALADVEAQLAADAEAQAAAQAEEQAQIDRMFAELVRRDPDDPTALGDVDAPVVLISWADFSCPYCAQYALEVEPQLVTQYVDAGLLRIEWRDYAYLSPASEIAAVAARAAGEQGQFWAAHHALMSQPLPGESARDAAQLRSLAETLGLDVERFEADLRSTELLARVEADLAQGTAIGVTATPTFLINGEAVIGAQPLEVFRAAIDRALERAGAAGP